MHKNMGLTRIQSELSAKHVQHQTVFRFVCETKTQERKAMHCGATFSQSHWNLNSDMPSDSTNTD